MTKLQITSHCLQRWTLGWRAQGDLAYLLITAANDKQWGKSSGKLHKIAESFRA